MESQDKRMCNPESFWSSGTIAGGTVAYDHVYDEDCFSDILNIFDFPMESLEGDGFAEDWASKLGPIPTEVFKDTHVACNTNSFSADLLPDYCNGRTSQLKHQSVLCNRTSKDYQNDMASQLKRQPTFFEEPTRQNLQRPYPCDIKTVESFQAHSPDSVLESRSSSSTSKGISFGSEIAIPVRTRSKRSRPTANPWFLSPLIFPINKEKRKRKKLPQPSVNVEVKNSLGRSNVARIKMCTHCEITKTPQWREGPSGPKTLCNACGVRYRSGRLYPEYRPAASPTFVPSLHSNSHRKVIEMREKAIRIQKGPVVNDVKKSLVSTPPEFAPVSSSLLFNCMQDLRN